MTTKFVRAVGSVAAIGMLALGSASPALAAKRHHGSHARRHVAITRTSATSTSSSGTAASGETPLTGSTLSSASAAALAAVPGATVSRASTETDGSVSGATYEVHVTKSDGSRVVVIEDSSFNVLATQADHGCGGGNGGNGQTP